MQKTLISIADPTVSSSSEISLAWYAGNKNNINTLEYIANILRVISEELKSNLILFGGSGGGFATLALIGLIKENVYGVVWNPQTSISKYTHSHVKNYIIEAFEVKIFTKGFYQIFEDLGIIHDLVKIYNSVTFNESRILYLQNMGDSNHVENHAKPFMEQVSAHKINENIYESNVGISFYYEYWGEGHIPPNKEVLKVCISNMCNMKNATKVIDSIP